MSKTQESKAATPENTASTTVNLNNYMWSEHFTGKELRARWPRGRNVTIQRIEEGSVYNEDEDQQIPKVLLHLQEIERPMVMNKTNLRFLADEFGSNTDVWIGQSVGVLPVKQSNEKFGIQMDKPFDEPSKS